MARTPMFRITSKRRPEGAGALASAWMAVTAAAAVWVTGCGAPRFGDPVAAMLDRERDPRHRLAAMSQSADGDRAAPARVAALEQILFAPGQPEELRLAAIDELLAVDEPRLRQSVARRLTQTHQPAVTQRLMDVGIDRRWPGFAGVIVRQYAREERGVEERDRAEYKALARLVPQQSVEQTVVQVLLGLDGQSGMGEQVAAWEVLHRIHGPTEAGTLLLTLPADTTMVRDLQAGWRELGVLPANRDGVLWLMAMRGESGVWKAARERVKTMTDEQRRGLAVRHVPMLAHLGPAVLAMDASSLRASLAASLAREEHHLIAPADDRPTPPAASLAAEALERMAWADLAVAHRLLQLLRDRELVASLFAQADADHADTATEHGGVLRLTAEGGVLAQAHPPLAGRHDRMYLPPPGLFMDLHTAGAHYHFHAQEHRYGEFAGPGAGDMRMVEIVGASCLVFTFIDADHLNVDYFQPGGIQLDMGTLQR